MTTTLSARVACTACGKQHRWRAELAGKKARCPCGAAVAMPAQPPAEAAEAAVSTNAGPSTPHAPPPTAHAPAPKPAAAAQPKAPPKQLGGMYAAALGGGTSKIQRALA